MGERLVRNEEVRGSIPLSSTKPAANHPTDIAIRTVADQIQPTQPGFSRLTQ